MLRIEALFSGLMVRTQKRKSKPFLLQAVGIGRTWSHLQKKKFFAIYSKQFQVN